MGQIFRVIMGIVVSGVVGWLSLLAFNALKIWQQFEAFEAYDQDDRAFDLLAESVERAIATMQGGSAVFLASAIVGVLFGEIIKTRSLIFYAGATGALTALFAAAFWQPDSPLGTANAASALAMAGFVAGGMYWLIASPSRAQAT